MQPTNKVRFETFSDSVFAIAVTLLAIQLRVPLLETNGFAFRELTPLVPGLLTFVLSFVTIAIFWVNHHQLTQVINILKRRRVLWLNMLFLLFVTLLPFITETISVNTLSPLAIAMYAFALFAASASFSVLRYWIHKSAGEKHVPMNRSLIGPIIYLLAIFAPLFSITLGYILLAIPPLFYFLPKGNVERL